ncbi:hypothetical protein pb186bvf_007480 [Paramecium bursaria]
MSDILFQITKKTTSRQSETRKMMKSQQSFKPAIPELRTTFKTPMNKTSLEIYRDSVHHGKYTFYNESQRKTLMDEVFKKMHPLIPRDYIEHMLQNFETELQKVCHEYGTKDLNDKYQCYQQSINKLLNQVLHVFEQLTAKLENEQKKSIEKEQELQQINAQHKSLQQMFSAIQQQAANDKYSNLSKSEKDKRYKELYMENQKLTKEQENIRSKLEQLEHMTNVQNLLQEIETIKRRSQDKINELLGENQVKEKQLQKLNLHYQNIKSQYSKLENESKAYQTIFESNKQQLDKILLENQINHNLMIRYREIAQMQKEDQETRALYVKEQLAVAQKAKEKLQQLQSKLDRFQIEKSKEIEPQPNKNHEQEKTGLERFQDLFSNDKTFFRMNYQSLQNDKARIVQRVGHSVAIMETYFNSQEIQLDKLTIGYCPFINYVEHHKKTIETEFNGIKYKRPSLQLLICLRHILDSKWNEMQLGLKSGFNDFVYSWLMNFQFDIATKSIKKIEQDAQKIDNQIVKFIVDLSNPVMQKNWEAITFQEFINELTSQDEIYFYLYIRNLLFRGPQCQLRSAFYDASHFIPLLQAEFVVNHILKQYEVITLQQVKRVLREKAIQKIANKSIFIIDSGFVLRILLEFYRVERRNRYKMLKMAFGNRAQNITFRQFRIVMIANYPNITDLELASLYKNAYSFTGSGVSIDSFFTYASDTGFFIRFLKIQPLIQTPKLENGVYKYDQYEQSFIIVTEYFKRFNAYNKRFKELLVDFGLEEVFSKIKSFEDLIKSQFQNPYDFYCWQFPQLVDEYMGLYRKINLMLYGRLFLQDTNEFSNEAYLVADEKYKAIKLGKNQQNMKDMALSAENFNRRYMKRDDFIPDYELVKSQMESLDQIQFYFNKISDFKKRQDFNQNLAAKKIQKFIKKKMTKFYNFVSSLLSAKLKTSLKQK